MNPKQNKNLERELGDRAAAVLADVVPDGWRASWSVAAGAADRGYDGVIEVRTPTKTVPFRAELIVGAYPMRTVRRILSEPVRRAELLIAPWLDMKVRQELAANGMSYLDLRGNVRIVSDDPAVFISLGGSEGADDKPRRVGETGTQSLRPPSAMKVVRALVDLDLTVPITSYDLAEAAGVSQPQAWRVVTLLAQEGLVERDGSSRISAYDWERVLERWTDDYSRTPVKSRKFATLQGVGRTMENLRSVDSDSYAITSAFAASSYAPLAQPRQLSLYSSDPESIASKLSLVETSSPPEVVIVSPRSDAVYARAQRRDDLTFCAPAQVYADLARERGRMRDQAEELLRWMRADTSWRA